MNTAAGIGYLIATRLHL